MICCKQCKEYTYVSFITQFGIICDVCQAAIQRGVYKSPAAPSKNNFKKLKKGKKNEKVNQVINCRRCFIVFSLLCTGLLWFFRTSSCFRISYGLSIEFACYSPQKIISKNRKKDLTSAIKLI
jgi:hypothetical protein